MVYTNENRFIVGNAKNILELNKIQTLVKNEYTSAVIGEVSAFDSWVELWVVEDTDYEAACTILENALSTENQPEWLCVKCHESNDSAFEHCWKCKTDKT